MLLDLDVPFRDASAGDLAWSLLAGAAAPDALASLDVGTGALAVRLHVLGASHAVELRIGERRLTEVVACGAPQGRPLGDAPSAIERDGLRYRFHATVDAPGGAAVLALGEELRAICEGRPDALAAAFPGASGALTALRTTVDGDPSRGRDAGDHAAHGPTAGWQTWHLYPERGEVVRTRTSVAVASGPPTAAAGEVRVPVLRGASR